MKAELCGSVDNETTPFQCNSAEGTEGFHGLTDFPQRYRMTGVRAGVLPGFLRDLNVALGVSIPADIMAGILRAQECNWR